MVKDVRSHGTRRYVTTQIKAIPKIRQSALAENLQSTGTRKIALNIPWTNSTGVSNALPSSAEFKMLWRRLNVWDSAHLSRWFRYNRV